MTRIDEVDRFVVGRRAGKPEIHEIEAMEDNVTGFRNLCLGSPKAEKSRAPAVSGATRARGAAAPAKRGRRRRWSGADAAKPNAQGYR